MVTSPSIRGFYRVSMATGMLMGALAGHGQLSISNLHVNPTLISPSTLFNATLQNTGEESTFWFDGHLRDKYGADVIVFSTVPQAIRLGTWSYSSGDLRMRTFTFAPNDLGRTAQQFQQLPGGDYRFCLHLRTNTEGGDELCEDLTVDEFISLDLVHPWNKDTIEEVRPTLSWTLTSSGPVRTDMDLRLVCVPLQKDRSPAQALAGERPLFTVPDLKERAVPYPPGVPDLVPGQCYAWQVERLDGSRVLDRSEPWGFCVRILQHPRAMKYIQLEQWVEGTVYEAFDDRIFFRYDEPYASRSVSCLIRTIEGKHLAVVTLNESSETPTEQLRTVGANHYDLDLTPYDLEPGVYDLLVGDEKGNSQVLRFKIRP